MSDPAWSAPGERIDEPWRWRRETGKDPDRVEFCPDGFVISREYELFAEFCEAVRRYQWLAVCTGDSGTGKSAYAERYSMWDRISPELSHFAYTHKPPAGISSCKSIYYKAQVANTPKQIVMEIERRRSLVSWLVDVASRIYGDAATEPEGLLGLEDRTDLLIVDEAQRLKSSTKEQLRDLYDEGRFGLVLMSAAPNFAQVLSVKGQYRSRIACVHNIKPLRAAPARRVAANPSIFGVSLTPEVFSDEDALTAMVQITHGNLAYLKLLAQQIEDTLVANELGSGSGAVTTEVVEAAARSMMIGS